jgi:U6 snRNA-associated Sm-like protein LSm1
VVLRDGRNLFGILRSYDQFGKRKIDRSINLSLSLSLGNLMLEDTIERYYLDLEWADEALGIFLVRGENVVLIGDIVL